MPNIAYGFDLQTARDVKETTRRVLGSTSSGRGITPGLSTSSQPVVVELLSDLPENDYKLHAARQVEWNGSEWVFVAPIDVRKITAAAIAKGTEDKPTRLRARSIGNMGWCVGATVTTANGGNTSATPFVTSSCCRCYEPEDVNQYNYEGEDLPRRFNVTGYHIKCCEGGATSPLLRDIPDGTSWRYERECDDEATVVWELNSAIDRLTVTHSTLGQIGAFNRRASDTDHFCDMRFDLEVGTRDRGCLICANGNDWLCVSPSAVKEPPVAVFGCPTCTDSASSLAYELQYDGASGPAADYFNGTTYVDGIGCRKDPLDHYEVYWDHNDNQFKTRVNISSGPYHAVLFLARIDDLYQVQDFDALTVMFQYLHPTGFVRHFFTNDEFNAGEFPCLETAAPLELAYSHSFGTGTPVTTFGGSVTIVPVEPFGGSP